MNREDIVEGGIYASKGGRSFRRVLRTYADTDQHLSNWVYYGRCQKDGTLLHDEWDFATRAEMVRWAGARVDK